MYPSFTDEHTESKKLIDFPKVNTEYGNGTQISIFLMKVYSLQHTIHHTVPALVSYHTKGNG